MLDNGVMFEPDLQVLCRSRFETAFRRGYDLYSAFWVGPTNRPRKRCNNGVRLSEKRNKKTRLGQTASLSNASMPVVKR